MINKRDQNGVTPEISFLSNKLDAILAILLRQLNDEYLVKWDKQDKHNMVKMLISLDFDNKEISKITGFAYGSVANIRSGIGRVKPKKVNRRRRK
jgi:hypothetical protein